jgi:hypothetical protein
MHLAKARPKTERDATTIIITPPSVTAALMTVLVQFVSIVASARCASFSPGAAAFVRAERPAAPAIGSAPVANTSGSEDG